MALALVTASFGAFATPAAATEQICPLVPSENWMAMSAAEQIGRDLGYDVAFVQPDGGCWTVYGRKDGVQFEIFLNPQTGEVVRVERGS